MNGRSELDAFLECGILAHGFLRVRCAESGHEKLVTHSCERGAAVRTVSRGLIRKSGMVLARADGAARLAFVQVRGLMEFR